MVFPGAASFPPVKAQPGWTGLRPQPAASGDDASAGDHLELSNTSLGLFVLGDLLCHHREMELAQKANKISLHLSLKPRLSLSA